MSMVYKSKEEFIKNWITKNDVVLDIGFWGQGLKIDNPNWAHKFLIEQAKEVYGLDTDYDPNKIKNTEKYKIGNAENFTFDVKFDVIFAGDLIEHLSNPGLFLQSCVNNLKEGGKILITTPNCFNLFNLAEKLTKEEPTVNNDHACYFNYKTLQALLRKNHFRAVETSFLYSLGMNHKESYKKKILNFVYFILSKFTTKFMETLVVVAQKEVCPVIQPRKVAPGDHEMTVIARHNQD